MTGSTITGTLTHGLDLGEGRSRSPLTITATGKVAPASDGAAGVFAGRPGQDGTITNQGQILGGFGGNYVGSGGIGVSATVSVSLDNSGTISGGEGGFANSALGAPGYQGVAGVDLRAVVSIVNTGAITGGYGNYNYGLGAAGAGGVGIYLHGGQLDNAGSVTGGGGGQGTGPANPHVPGGDGAAGIVLADGSMASNSGFVAGGYGNYGTYGGGSGGDGADVQASTLTNTGTITGGSGGYA